MTVAAEPLTFPYSDNYRLTVAARLAAEIENDPQRLWVASGYFAPSVWRVLGEALGRLEEFRLLLGKDFELANLERGQEEARIADLVRQAIRRETEPPGLPSRAEAEGVAELIAFLERMGGHAEPAVKLWEGDGFLHAKAYLLRSSVGIGSANFTGNGLTQNRELVGWRQDRDVVREVERWFRDYWESENATDYTATLIAALRATPLVSDDYTPHDVLIRALASRYGIDRPPSLEQAGYTLKWFQEDAAFRVIRLLNGRARGALLADAVGLGKTYVAMAVINHFLYTHAESRRGRGRPVLVIVPASLVPMWQQVLEEHGLMWACQLVTTQSLRRDYDVRQHVGADLVVIDEAHRLRSAGVWFRKVMDLLTSGERAGDRRVLLLTATPVNTGMADLVNLLRVLAKGNRSVWAPEIADFERYLRRVEDNDADPFPVLDRSVVRRSRSDILRAQDEARAAAIHVEPLQLPERRPQHATYVYGGAGDLFDTFARTLRNLVLAPYDLERFRRNDPEEPEPLPLRDAEGNELDAEDAQIAVRPGTLAALCAIGLLVRFQSSLAAIRRSLRRVDAVQRRFLEALEQDPPRLLDLQGDVRVRRLLAEESTVGDRDEAEEPGEAGDFDEAWELVLAEAAELSDPDRYDWDAVRAAVERDRQAIADLLEKLPNEAQDGKIAALVEALRRPLAQARDGRPGLAGRRVLVFSQFRDTARYVHGRLVDEEFPAEVIDGRVDAGRRRAITAWFDPDRAGARELEGRAEGEEGPQLLVSTDVLAEGHNLQLADAVVNFDLHFNPQIAVQRAGRIDRIGSPHARVYLVSFLPPEGLERHIGLLARLDERFRRIHGLGLGDEQVTTLTADRQVQTLEQLRRLYYSDDATVLDEVERTWTLGSTDYMRQPLEAFLTEAGADRVKQIPVGVSSVRRVPADWRRGAGAFIALAAPAGRTDGEDERDTYWRFYARNEDGTWGEPLTDEVEIFRAIACRRGEPRAALPWDSPGPTAVDWDLLRRAASDLAHQLTRERSTAAVAAGASERSRQLRNELRGNLAGLELEDTEDLLERLLQVRVEDFDGRSGWRRFADARRRVRRARTLGERREAGEEVVQAGLELLGRPVAAGDQPAEHIEVAPEEIQLVAYEALVPRETIAEPTPGRLFAQEGDQLALGERG